MLEHELKLTNDNSDIKVGALKMEFQNGRLCDSDYVKLFNVEVYREIDGIQLSRAEACTCLPLMEMMASGIPAWPV